MDPTSAIPEVTTPEQIKRKSGYQSLQPVTRPEYWGVDLDLARRPGVPMLHDPRPFPNTRYPPERQQGKPAVPRHGRSNKPVPPVFGTSTPLHGLSGMVKRVAYRYPDHEPTHWVLMLLGDRIDSWEHRVGRLLPFAIPLVGFALTRHSLRRGAAARRARGPLRVVELFS